MTTIQSTYQDLKGHYKKAIIQFGIIGVIIAVATYVGLSIGKVDVMKIMEQIMDMLGGKEAVEELSKQERHETFWHIFSNNWMVCAQVLLLALIPLPLYMITFAVNSAMIGMVAYIMHGTGQGVFKSFVLGILPHGIIELPMIIIAIAIAMKINNAIYKWIFSKFQNNQIGTEIKKALLQLIFVLTPGMLVAGLIESYITPILLAWGYR